MGPPALRSKEQRERSRKQQHRCCCCCSLLSCLLLHRCCVCCCVCCCGISCCCRCFCLLSLLLLALLLLLLLLVLCCLAVVVFCCAEPKAFLGLLYLTTDSEPSSPAASLYQGPAKLATHHTNVGMNPARYEDRYNKHQCKLCMFKQSKLSATSIEAMQHALPSHPAASRRPYHR